ncbi:hypothetical protein [Vibrio metoecus]|uniref:hypothetical protein n=1 Tax=Vibrio metoecus TaxID=1481663 RepID=UPI000BA914B6|nr:hypothetical protein [Vibrio metoecus]PAR27658.1 hypothetical protein CGU00_13455 [Vibrio metoecus]PAR60084.1 hypothetical protein CGT90_17580 [Vibrio metoecus]
MAAVKLSKARLAQIIITLAVLISAFVWRTWSYKSEPVVTCHMSHPCEFRIDGRAVTISRHIDLASDFTIYTFLPWNEDWSIAADGKTTYQQGRLQLSVKKELKSSDVKINHRITLKLVDVM